MRVNNSSGDLAGRIQQLVEQREHHAQAITTIDATLDQIGSLLRSGRDGIAIRRGPGRPPGPSMSTGVGRRGRRRRGRGSFSTTAEESILSFVKEHRNPTTQEIKTHWNSEGRGGTADNALSKLFKERKLKRTPLGEGIRGSRYSLP